MSQKAVTDAITYFGYKNLLNFYSAQPGVLNSDNSVDVNYSNFFGLTFLNVNVKSGSIFRYVIKAEYPSNERGHAFFIIMPEENDKNETNEIKEITAGTLDYTKSFTVNSKVSIYLSGYVDICYITWKSNYNLSDNIKDFLSNEPSWSRLSSVD